MFGSRGGLLLQAPRIRQTHFLLHQPRAGQRCSYDVGGPSSHQMGNSDFTQCQPVFLGCGAVPTPSWPSSLPSRTQPVPELLTSAAAVSRRGSACPGPSCPWLRMGHRFRPARGVTPHWWLEETVYHHGRIWLLACLSRGRKWTLHLLQGASGLARPPLRPWGNFK